MRFFQIGANNFSKDSHNLKKNVERDVFMRKVIHKLTIDKDMQKARKKIITDLYDPSQCGEIKARQKRGWEAIPDLIKTRSDLDKLNFKGKVNEVIPLAVKLFNYKKPEYLRDYKNLNYFTHWSSFNYLDIDEEVKEMIFLRELNFCLCYLHDSLNILYDYLEITVPEHIACLRQEFIYLS